MRVGEVLSGWDAVEGWQEDLHRHLLAHPELSFQERETATSSTSGRVRPVSSCSGSEAGWWGC